MIRLLLMAVLVGCAGTQAAPAGPAAPAAPPFRPTLDAHLQAIEQRKLEPLFATVDEHELLVILPNGKTIDSRQAYEAFHREWFAETDWTMKFNVERVVETPGMAYGLVTYTYADPSGSKSRWLLLVFRLSNGAWKLIHDQNTPRE